MSDLYYIGLGGNLGDRIGYLRSALRRVGSLGKVVAVSRVYETAPQDFMDQGPFLNAVLALCTRLDPATLLDRLKRIERELGRSPGPRFGPREIDLDVLLGPETRETDPILPHPRMHERAFVLRPLADLDAKIEIPGRGRVGELLGVLSGQRVALYRESLDAP